MGGGGSVTTRVIFFVEIQLKYLLLLIVLVLNIII